MGDRKTGRLEVRTKLSREDTSNTMGYEEIIYATENNVATITLNRPQAMNALTLKTVEEFNKAVDEANKDGNIRVIVVTGAGRAFCAGDDIGIVFGAGEAPGEAAGLRDRETELGYLLRERLYSGGGVLLTTNKPTIAAVNGVAVGYGCDISLMCDMRVASEKARFGELFLQVGLIPGEALFLLPRLVGLAKAYEMMLTTDLVDAQEAYRIGLVNKVVPHEQLMTVTMELATKLASQPPVAVQMTKEGIRKGLSLPGDEFYQWKSLAQRFCFGTDDHREGARAFVEKRKPVFKGK